MNWTDERPLELYDLPGPLGALARVLTRLMLLWLEFHRMEDEGYRPSPECSCDYCRTAAAWGVRP